MMGDRDVVGFVEIERQVGNGWLRPKAVILGNAAGARILDI